MPLQGSCNCGSIQVTIQDPPADKSVSIFCHCTNCRRQSGAGELTDLQKRLKGSQLNDSVVQVGRMCSWFQMMQSP